MIQLNKSSLERIQSERMEHSRKEDDKILYLDAKSLAFNSPITNCINNSSFMFHLHQKSNQDRQNCSLRYGVILRDNTCFVWSNLSWPHKTDLPKDDKPWSSQHHSLWNSIPRMCWLYFREVKVVQKEYQRERKGWPPS